MILWYICIPYIYHMYVHTIIHIHTYTYTDIHIVLPLETKVNLYTSEVDVSLLHKALNLA